MTARSDSEPAEFILPDISSDCYYSFRVNPHYDAVFRVSEQWLFDKGRLAEPKITKFVGYLAAACYPDADAFHLRVCSGFMDWWKMDEFDVDSALGMRECCISAFRDLINCQMDKLLERCVNLASRRIQTFLPES